MFPGGLVTFANMEAFYASFPATHHKRLLKKVLLIIAMPIVAFIGLALILAIGDELASDETYAASEHMSIDQCISTMKIFGAALQAREICMKRQPKRKR